jgi:hypothetical protein
MADIFVNETLKFWNTPYPSKGFVIEIENFLIDCIYENMYVLVVTVNT